MELDRRESTGSAASGEDRGWLDIETIEDLVEAGRRMDGFHADSDGRTVAMRWPGSFYA